MASGFLLFRFIWISAFCYFVILLFFLPETHFELHPLHPQQILANIKTVTSHSIFFLTAVIASLLYGLVIIFNVVGPFLIQKVLMYSVVSYGHIALILGCAYCFGSIVNRLLITYLKPMRVAIYAMIGSLITNFLMLGLAFFIPINLSIILIPVWLIFFLGGLIFPNRAGKFSSIFPKLGGTASAMSGFLIAGGVFVMSAIATLLNTTSQIPLTCMFIGILGVSFILLICVIKRDKIFVDKTNSKIN